MGAKIGRFEDFIAWQKARNLTAEIYVVTDRGSFARDFALKHQIRRASISIMSNIAEGFERGRPSEFHQFLCVAKASCAELRSQLYVALDAKHISTLQFTMLDDKAQEVGRVLGGLRISVQNRRNAGKLINPKS